MEIIVCLLTTLFFAVLGIRDLKTRPSKTPDAGNPEFIVLPHYKNTNR